jgi:predicted amidohydrolase
MMNSKSKLRVAAVQAFSSFLDLEGSLELLEGWVERAADNGAELIVFPESWLPGYPAWLDVSPAAALWDHPGAKRIFARLWENSLEVPGPAVERISALARKRARGVVVGAHERKGRSLYNVLLTFGPGGELLNLHRKLVPTYTERLLWGRGDGEGLRTVPLAGVRVGGLICWEHWMPTARQVLHDAGEQVHVAAWPWVKEMHQIAVRHYAFEGRCFVVAAGGLLRTGELPPELPVPVEAGDSDDALILKGGSLVAAPDGRLIAGPVYDEETLVLADCELGEIAAESMTLDVSGHYSRPDLFQLRFRPGEPG